MCPTAQCWGISLETGGQCVKTAQPVEDEATARPVLSFRNPQGAACAEKIPLLFHPD